MIVETSEDFEYAVKFLADQPFVSFDTETTGLFPYKNDQIFAAVFHAGGNTFYFNFHRYDGKSVVWPRKKILLFQPIFNKGIRFAHNAMFDMHFLGEEGIEFNCDIHCTMVQARLLSNDMNSYSLDSCCERDLGKKKDDRVMEYITEHKLWDWVEIPGKAQRDKVLYFDRVPMDIIHPYAEMDAELCYELGMLQEARFSSDEIAAEAGGLRPPLRRVSDNEKKLIKVVYEMERHGFLVDQRYCEEASKFEAIRIKTAEQAFQSLTGKELVDSGEAMAPIFEGLGFPLGLTEKGGFELDDSFLEAVGHPIAKIIQTYRDATKRRNTYFESYLYYSDGDGRIHAGLKQAGTKTGRFSSQSPNLQNVPKADDDTSEYPVRRAFIPEKDHALVMIDYNQMEFRLMLEYAKQGDLINKINAGFDPHQATSDLTGLSRKQAKVLNFGLLYGMGLSKLATAIKTLTREEKVALTQYDRCADKLNAKHLLPVKTWEIVDPILQEMKKFKRTYYDSLPMVEDFNIRTRNIAAERGYVFNWFGRRFDFSNPRFAYRAANSIIQGGCADVTKLAMTTLGPVLPELGARMVLTVHDELIFNVLPEDLHKMELVKTTMETVYPYSRLQLTCSASHSLDSWGTPREGLIVKEEGNNIQGSVLGRITDTSACMGGEDSATRKTWDA